MAQKSFLSPEQLAQAQELLNPPLVTPDGDVRQGFFSAEVFSHWVGGKVEELLKSLPGWKDCHPVILGSWARGELAPNSDIDILFCGDEVAVKTLTEAAHLRGLRLRYRMPQNPSDWTENVEAFDVLALLKARPLTSEAARKLFGQQKKIWARKKSFRQKFLTILCREREARARRYDSITNYLEPNLKFGPGGLRDLEQGLQIYALYAEKFVNPAHALDVLNYYRQYLLTLRQKMHLLGGGDVLASAAQFDLAGWMGFKNQKDFMRDLQRGLSRVSFYADWIVAVAKASDKELKALETLEFQHMEDLNSALHKNSGVLIQKKVREKLDEVFPDHTKNGRRRGKILSEVLDVSQADAYVVGVFRSRLIDKLLPEIRRLVGYVQHDQYHRFTADSHIMQACREVKRVFLHPRSLGALRFLHETLTAYDWKVLSWCSLYHDLAKGLGAEDHAELGVSLVIRDFKSYGFGKGFTQDVAWMVKNHLELSQAAFRKNPKDPEVWRLLKGHGVEGARLRRLAVFTVIDIRATNPEAWNEWKAKLLKELVVHLESKPAQDDFAFQKLRIQKKMKIPPDVIGELDASLLENLSIRELVADLHRAEQSSVSLKPRILRTRTGGIWIRFHDKKDRKGLLSEYVHQLHSLGARIRNASVHTLPRIGVYDWFQILPPRNLKQLERLLEKITIPPRSLPAVYFDQIQWISQSDKEWVISFRGRDQSGLLATAAQALHEEGLNVMAAKVHTWGRQVDDIFFVKPKGESQDIIQRLQARLVMQR